MNYVAEYNLFEKMSQLESEGIDINAHGLLDGTTYDIESKDGKCMGFITLRVDDDIDVAILQHFYMLPELRKKDGGKSARMFTKRMVKLLIGLGLTRIVIPIDKKYLARCVEYFFKVSPYAEDEHNNKYYLVKLKKD